MIDTTALAQFISETAFVFSYQIAGAVIAFTFILNIIFFFTRVVRQKRSFLNV